jgi:hypothetical protein
VGEEPLAALAARGHLPPAACGGAPRTGTAAACRGLPAAFDELADGYPEPFHLLLDLPDPGLDRLAAS